jgi:hypothetical protein
MRIRPARTTEERFRKAGVRRLLLLSCSQRKVHTSGKIAALQRYDGPAFQVVRRYLRETTDHGLVIRILSAEYGLITAADAIENYDRKMDVERVAQLTDTCLATLRTLIREQGFAEVFVCMSRLYIRALEGIDAFCDSVKYAAPGQGTKLASLKRWLWHDDGRTFGTN